MFEVTGLRTQSEWYEQRYIHRDWYRTEDSRINIAHQTGTTLQPDVTNDKEWVEAKVLPILFKCIQINLIAERYTDVLGLLRYFEFYLNQLAIEGRLKQAFEILDQIAETVIGVIAPAAEQVVINGEVLEKLAIAEHIASLPISIILAYHDVIKTRDRKSVSAEIDKIRWKNDESIYFGNFPSYCLPRLEWFRPRLEFEIEVEDKSISPLWYQLELMLQVEAEQLVENAKTIIFTASEKYKKWINTTENNKHLWLAASLISREWEYWHKAEHLFPVLLDRWNSFSLNRLIEGLPWSELVENGLNNQRQERQKEVLKWMSQKNVLLALSSRPEGFPDYAGQFLHTSGESFFDALYEGNTEMITTLFRPYFYGCLLRFENLRPKTANVDWRAQQDFKIASATLLDLMDLSGYARLMADYHNKIEIWNHVSDIWDEYLNKQQTPPPITLLAAAVSLTEMAFEIPHRSVLRTTWRQGIRHRLADIPRKEVSFSKYSLSSDSIAEHESELIRIFARDRDFTFNDGIDVFIAVDLIKRNDAKELNFGRRRMSFVEDVERERQRYQTQNDYNHGEED